MLTLAGGSEQTPVTEEESDAAATMEILAPISDISKRYSVFSLNCANISSFAASAMPVYDTVCLTGDLTCH